jgi:3'(2'), 5'-bisphosphate nucleotidase
VYILPDGIDLNNLVENIKVFSWRSGDILQNYSEKMRDLNFRNKALNVIDNNDPVTVADLEVNEQIVNNIKEKYPNTDWEFLTEENVKRGSNSLNIYSDWLWILDPLDGTKDFIQGTGNYAMHLALNYKQKSYIGFVLIPERDELWITNGQKVWCERRDRSLLETNLSNKQNLNEMILVTSKNHKNELLARLIEKINFNDVIEMGSVGCKISSILRGESDIYISLSIPGQSSPKDWDFAAPEAILKAAGGAVTNLDNEELTYGESNYEKGGIIIASNDGKNHRNICLKIKEIIKEYNIYPL